MTTKLTTVVEGMEITVEVAAPAGVMCPKSKIRNAQNVLTMCKTVNDVTNCCKMGDFRFVSWSPAAAVGVSSVSGNTKLSKVTAA